MACSGCGKRAAEMMAGAIKLAASELNLVQIAKASTIAARRAACEACDRWDHGRCNQCGCFTFAKTRLKSEACPLGKWPDA